MSAFGGKADMPVCTASGAVALRAGDARGLALRDQSGRRRLDHAPHRGALLRGVLWRVTLRDLVALNAYEGVDTELYLRRLTAGAVRRTPGGGARLYCAAARGGEATAGLYQHGGRGGARMAAAGALY